MTVLIDELIREGLITAEQLNDARIKRIGAKKPLQELLVEMGFIAEEQLVSASSKIFNMPVTQLSKETIDPSAVRLVPYELAMRYGILPLRKEGDALVLAMSDPQDIMALDDIRLNTGMSVKPLLAAKSEINNHIKKYYQAEDNIYDILKNVMGADKVEIVTEDASEFFLDERAQRSEDVPAVKICNLILSDAVKQRASDIHIESQEKTVKVRYRIDGDLRNIMDLPVSLHSSLAARLKVLAQLDTAENRKPQDGRIKISVNGRKVDLRVSTIPTFYGEKIEMRLLDIQAAKTGLESMGFQGPDLDIYKQAITAAQGLILVTGPTGSGKTSTLYATLNVVKTEKNNIITIEDPIEYLIDGLNQMQVNPVKDLTFANALKSILRQDPNVILIGEIRDKETAEMAFQASLTGHLVLSTLHTNNAVASITRLVDIGLEPYLISSALILVVAQRLVKMICPHCKEKYQPDGHLLSLFKSHIDQLGIKEFYHGSGCSYCGFTGFLGRTAIFEIFRISEKIRGMIAQRFAEDEILSEAKKSGLKTLARAGLEKVSAGITTLEEIFNIVGAASEEEAVLRSAQAGKDIKILIVDDEEDILKILEKRLTDAGYRVVKARDGQEAVAFCNKEKPDLVISDVTMPKMNGFEEVKALRSKLETAVIPVILLTAREDKESELQGLDAGADDYLTKPFDSDKLLARVKMLLRRKQ
ncbi:MAG: Flp pilus assembly complex ATPase component TadA [Candidatus Omnitrophica bacterium]|jgi:type IV pilus assembly protein PilB|nr:Flp pilus assembly complex ATPase component TadA [Candidatus Omnitrophota bacterium]